MLSGALWADRGGCAAASRGGLGLRPRPRAARDGPNPPDDVQRAARNVQRMTRSAQRATYDAQHATCNAHTTYTGPRLRAAELAIGPIDRSRGRGASSHRRNIVSYAAVRCMGVCARRATAHSGLRTHARTHGHKPRPRRGLNRADLTGLCAQQPVRCAVALRHSTGTVARGEEPLGTAVAPHCDAISIFGANIWIWMG